MTTKLRMINIEQTPGFISVSNLGAPFDEKNLDSYDDLAILPTRNLVLFPEVTIPINLVRESSVKTVEKAERDGELIGVVCQLNPEIDDPGLSDLFSYGVYARVLKVIKMPDGGKMALMQASSKFKILGPGDSGLPLHVKVKTVTESAPKNDNAQYIALGRSIREAAFALMQTGDSAGPSCSAGSSDFLFNIDDIKETTPLINLLASMLPIEPSFKMNLLANRFLRRRGEDLLAELTRTCEMLNMTREMQRRAKNSLDDKQRSAFLEQQMEAIRSELYGDDDDAERLKKRADSVALPENVRKTFEKEIEKLKRVPPQSPDYSVQYTYLQTLLDLPWGISTPVTDDIGAAKNILDTDHYGLEKVKERILEQLAVMINNPEGKAPIICLVGPPGVGKTSLGQSIARSLGRKYQRVSLGGVNDEAEIRGHRRTYIGALPGRIIDAVKRAGSSNPVLLLDEVDKLGKDFKGDPSAALLEVLDPEQNCHFHDNYIDVDFDLSNVLFIATANTLSTLSQPLLDRMEVIDIAGYLPEEKAAIAKGYFLPRINGELNTEWLNVNFPDETIHAIIDRYTSESGVRQLEKRLSQIIRKQLLATLNDVPSPTTAREAKRAPHTITADDLQGYLGAPIYSRDRYEGNEYAGVVTGLAWTAVGGEILFIESALTPGGKSDKPTLTGNLGDVMKESALIALQYVKAHASRLGIDQALFDKYALHVHVPEGAIPKDGPSAGITMATSIVSAFTQRRVKERLAMTGEITLRGRVLPVGGIKEKILAAKRAGINEIILSKENRKDVEDINARYVEGLKFHYVTSVDEVIEIAITDEPVAHPVEL